MSAEKASGMASVGRHAAIYAIGTVLGKAVAFIMLPVYTRYLTPADYGIAALIEMTLDVIGIVAGTQIVSGVFRFYHKVDTDEERRAVVSTALLTMITTFTIMGAVTFLTAPALSQLLFGTRQHANLLRMAAGSFALQSMLIVPLGLARLQDRSVMVVGINLAKLVLSLTLNILFIIGLGMGLRGVFLSTLLTNLVLGTVVCGWAIRQVGLRPSRQVLGQLMRYGAPLMGMQAATFTMTFADRYFLQAAGNETMVGLYNLAYQFGFMMLWVSLAPAEMVWGPRRFQVARGPDPSPLLAQGFRLINVSVITVAVGIVLFVSDVLRVMATPPFHPAAALVPIILIAYVFHGWATMQDIGILVRERTEVSTAVNVAAALVALAGFAILIPRYFAVGAAVATVIAFSVRWSLTYVMSQRLWPVRYDWGPVRRLVLIGVAVCGTSLLLPSMHLLLSIAVHLALLALYFLLVWSGPVLTRDEKTFAAATARRVVSQLAVRLRLRRPPAALTP